MAMGWEEMDNLDGEKWTTPKINQPSLNDFKTLAIDKTLVFDANKIDDNELLGELGVMNYELGE